MTRTECGASAAAAADKEMDLIGVVEPFEGAMLTNNVRLVRRIAHGSMGASGSPAISASTFP
ncbi:MAG TPA: hypothetical protein VNO21_21390 [Polyangiaceae bacterium]|nr:hypothetical protein [Polyangiaceae bacterium]